MGSVTDVFKCTVCAHVVVVVVVALVLFGGRNVINVSKYDSCEGRFFITEKLMCKM